MLECIEEDGLDDDDEPEHLDWPEVAVIWCRSEGCTAPLLSESMGENETDEDDSDQDSNAADSDNNDSSGDDSDVSEGNEDGADE